MSWDEIFPPFGLVIRCGPVELRGLSQDDIPALTHLATRGVHNDGRPMPFSGTDWSALPPAELPLNSSRFYWRTWAEFTPERWTLPTVVRRDGEIVGCQDVRTEDFVIRRLASTGSWLGLAHQRRGTGTLMRQAICAFMFDELGATQMRTEAYADNAASLGVSRVVGYREYDRIPMVREGAAAGMVALKLTPDSFVRPVYPLEVQGAAEFREFIGL